MHIDIHEWFNILVRTAHFIAGIMWIGTSFYFVWLDSAFEPPVSPQKGLEGETHLVHGGFFYRVEKRRFGAGETPRHLHWFIWEATLTWITGFLMLWIMYYTTNGAYLTDPNVKLLTPAEATAIGLAVVFGGWFVYDAFYRSPLARSKAGSSLALVALLGLVYFLTHTFSGRGAFIELGAMFGTIMVVNVWVHILPNQRAIIKAANEGREPNFELGKKAKRRSMHNSYLTIPVLFTMISNHFSSLTDNRLNWVALILVIIAGASARHIMITASKWPLIPAAASILGLMALTSGPGPIKINVNGPKVSWSQANEIIQLRCAVCHSSKPSSNVFHSPPQSVMLDNPVMVKAFASRIMERAVVQRTMPFGNATGMTDEERELLGRWIVQGANTSP